MKILVLLSVALLCALACLLLRGSGRWTARAASLATLLYLLLSIVWLASDQFTGEGFNAAVLYHLSAGLEGAGFAEYWDIALATAIALALSLLVFIYLLRRLGGSGAPAGRIGSAIAIVTLSGSCVFHPTVNGLLATQNMALYGPDSLLARLTGDAEETVEQGLRLADFYVQPTLGETSGKPRNLVLLYAESLEATYFDESIFPGLISELRELAPAATRFTAINQLPGAGFTIGGIVASQCGIPLATSGHPNSMAGMDRFLSGATCIGDLLSERGYALHYMGGAKLSFAGKGKFFETHGYQQVQGLEELRGTLPDPDYEHSWGLYDDFLLDSFYARFEALAAAGQPFALVGLTLDTHHPRGHQSRSCEEHLYGDGENAMLNAVRCADKLIAGLIRRIRSSPWADDTLFVLASDHLALKNDAIDLLKSGQRRNLLWVFDGKQAAGKEVSLPGSSIDSAAILAHYLGGASAFGLGRDLLASEQSFVQTVPRPPWQIREWRNDLAAYWDLPDQINSLTIDPTRSVARVNEREFRFPLLGFISDGRLESLRFEFDSRVELPSYIEGALPDQTLLWIDQCERVRAFALALPSQGICVFLGRLGGEETFAARLDETLHLEGGDLRKPLAAKAHQNAAATRLKNLSDLKEYGVAGLQQRNIRLRAQARVPEIEIMSSGGPGRPSQLVVNGRTLRMARGLTLLQLASNGRVTRRAHLDLCDSAADDSAVISAAFEQHRAKKDTLGFIVVAHDSATCGKPLAPVFDDLNLRGWKDLGFRQPYVAFIGTDSERDTVAEFVGDRENTLRVMLGAGE